MKRCDICNQKLNLLSSDKNKCIDGYVCDDCYTKSYPQKDRKDYTVSEIKNNIMLQGIDLEDETFDRLDSCDYDNQTSNAKNSLLRIIINVVFLLIFCAIGFGIYIHQSRLHEKHLKEDVEDIESNLFDNDVSDDSDNSLKETGYPLTDVQDDDSEATTTTSTTAPKPTPPKYNSGEEIWIMGTVDSSDSFAKELYLYADDVLWTVSCKNIDEFYDLVELCGNKTIKIIGNVSANYKITFTSVEVNGNTYNSQNFKKIDIGKSNALKTAKSYLDYSSFSRTGLIEQLEYEKYTHEQAVYAVDNCGADWYEQAYETAISYLEYSSFSRQELIEQLVYEGFTQDQAEYGVQQVGY